MYFYYYQREQIQVFVNIYGFIWQNDNQHNETLDNNT